MPDPLGSFLRAGDDSFMNLFVQLFGLVQSVRGSLGFGGTLPGQPEPVSGMLSGCGVQPSRNSIFGRGERGGI